MATGQEYPHLSNAPIVEALIDIQVIHREPPKIESLRAVIDSFKDEFPVVEDRYQASLRFELGEQGPKAFTDQSPGGFVAKSTDGLDVMQVLAGRLAVSRLAPYTNWDDLREKTARIWAIYLKNAKPVRIARLATRYINRISLPNEPFDLSKVLRKPVELPDELPQTVGNYFVRLAIPDPDSGSVVSLTQVFEGSAPGNPPSFVIDIDAFVNVDMQSDSPGLWEALESLRAYKNRIFFNCLTDEMIERFK